MADLEFFDRLSGQRQLVGDRAQIAVKDGQFGRNFILAKFNGSGRRHRLALGIEKQAR